MHHYQSLFRECYSQSHVQITFFLLHWFHLSRRMCTGKTGHNRQKEKDISTWFHVGWQDKRQLIFSFCILRLPSSQFHPSYRSISLWLMNPIFSSTAFLPPFFCSFLLCNLWFLFGILYMTSCMSLQETSQGFHAGIVAFFSFSINVPSAIANRCFETFGDILSLLQLGKAGGQRHLEGPWVSAHGNACKRSELHPKAE